MSSVSVEILLPTYNGSRYVAPLLESLCSQTWRDFTLITRDDGSTDDTIEQMLPFSEKLRITRILNRENANIGVVRSFEMLIASSRAELLFFCDQDDLWNPLKVEHMVHRYLQQKDRNGSTPQLLYCDLTLIDENGFQSGDSFLRTNNVNPFALFDPYYLALKNPAPGCAMAVNRPLVEAALPFSPETFMHDWWMAIAAGLCGGIVFIDEKLVQYRVHATNTLGVTSDRPRSFFSLFSNWLNIGKFSRIMALHRRHITQGRAVFSRCGSRFSPPRYFIKVIVGRLIMPRIVRLTGRGRRYSYSWVAPDNK